jgi:hypothetical protein
MRSGLAKAIGAAVCASLFASVVTMSGSASAAAEVSGTGKGIVGGALLGGEVGLLGLSAFRAKPGWVWYTVPPVLAIGGGIGGYVIERNAAAEVPVYMLAGGMALAIPTIVATLSAHAYQPSSEDSTPVDAVPADAGSIGGTVGGSVSGGVAPSTPTTTTGNPSTPLSGAGSGSTTTTPTPPPQRKPARTSSRRATMPSFALVSWDDAAPGLRVGVPLVAMTPSYSQAEVAKFGLVQRYELRATLLDVHF